jgi:hypothetical protein
MAIQLTRFLEAFITVWTTVETFPPLHYFCWLNVRLQMFLQMTVPLEQFLTNLKYRELNPYLYLDIAFIQGANSVDLDLCNLIWIYNVCFLVRNNLLNLLLKQTVQINPDQT